MHVQNYNCRENCEIWTLLNCHWLVKWPISYSKTRFFPNWILRNTHRHQPFEFYEIAELRKTWVSQKRKRAILRKMTFANDCANCCFFVQNWCAKKEKFCVSFRKNCAKVLRMETLRLTLIYNSYLIRQSLKVTLTDLALSSLYGEIHCKLLEQSLYWDPPPFISTYFFDPLYFHRREWSMTSQKMLNSRITDIQVLFQCLCSRPCYCTLF